MKVSEQFKSTIKAYLDNMAAVDSLFAPVYQKPTKNIDNCITYISLIFRLRMEILWFGYWKAFRTFTKRESCCIIVYSATPIIREKIR